MKRATTFGGRRGVAGEEGYGGLAAFRAAGLGHLGEAVVGADVERVGRVGAPGVHLLAVPVRAFAHCSSSAHKNRIFIFLRKFLLTTAPVQGVGEREGTERS